MSTKRKIYNNPINTKRIRKQDIFRQDMSNPGIFFGNLFQDKQDKPYKQEMKELSKLISKMMDKMNVMNKKIANIENMLEKDNEKSLKIDDLSYQLNSIKIHNEELKYRINKKGDNIDYYA